MRNIMKRAAPLFVLALMTLGTARNAQAVGTAANTPITSTASMTYTIGGVVQVPPPPATIILIVDRKINVTVSRMDSINVTVTPGQLTAVLNFKVQNTGNSPMKFVVSAVNLAEESATAVAGLSTKTTPAAGAYAEHTKFPMGYQAGPDVPLSATLGTNPGVDDYTYAYVVVNIPTAGVINGDIFAFALKARAAYADGTAISHNIKDSGLHYDASNALWNVFADGHDAWNDDIDNDGSAADRSAFRVTASVLALTKTYVTISDPVNNTTNPRNIPGAIVEYIIAVTNTGTVSADNVTINDLLIASTVLEAAPYGTLFSCAQESHDNGLTWVGPVSVTCSSNTVNANLGNIPIGTIGDTTHKLRYRAVIQ